MSSTDDNKLKGYFVVKAQTYTKKGSTEGVYVFFFSKKDWKAFNALTAQERNDHLVSMWNERNVESYPKTTAKYLNGGSGTVYEVEYKATQDGGRTIWPSSATFEGRINNEATRIWDQQRINDLRGAKAYAQGQKEGKASLADDMTLRELKAAYKLSSANGRAAMIANLVKELTNATW